MDNKKSFMKLLPAAAVIAAVAVTGFQAESEKQSETKVQTSDNELMKSSELKSLISTAYSYESNDQEEASDGIAKTSKRKTKSKKKKAGITTGKAKALPAKSAAATGEGQGSKTTPTTSVPEGGYKDGTYQGSGTGFGGTITVQVKISGGKIASIEILSAAGETGSYFASAKGVISKMISGQTPNVDAVSGATYSSNGIIQAVQNALAKAGNGKTAKATKTTKKKTPVKTTKKTTLPVKVPEPTGEVMYKDGTYSGEAEGFDGPVKVTVTIKDGKITGITNTNTDTKEYFDKAWSGIQPKILEKQAVYGVDTVSGATFSSNGIIGAVQKALEQAIVNATPTPEATPTPMPTAAPAPVVPDNPSSLYKDGTYSGEAEGFDGIVKVTVTIRDGKITEATNTNEDTPKYFSKAWNNIYAALLEKQSADGIDTVSRATYSSNGIINAMKKALAQAKVESTVTPEPTATPTPTVTPKPTATPTPTAVPEPTITPEPTTVPEPTVTPEPTAVPEPTVTPEPTTAPGAGYKDGTYTGTGNGFNGKVTVIITVSGGNIVSATYSGSDDEPEFSSAWNGIYNQIMGKQSADGIDTVTDATYSSKGLIQAFQSAISQAK